MKEGKMLIIGLCCVIIGAYCSWRVITTRDQFNDDVERFGFGKADFDLSKVPEHIQERVAHHLSLWIFSVLSWVYVIYFWIKVLL